MTRILTDIDGIAGNFVGATLIHLNKSRAAAIQFSENDVSVFNITRALRLNDDESRSIEELWTSSGFALRLPEYPKSLAWINAMRLLATVVAVTTPLDVSRKSPHWVGERYEWLLQRNFRKDQIVFASDKEFIDGDAIIEDDLMNASAWANRHPRGVAFLINRPWNQGRMPGSGVVARVDSLAEVYQWLARRTMANKIDEIENAPAL